MADNNVRSQMNSNYIFTYKCLGSDLWWVDEFFCCWNYEYKTLLFMGLICEFIRKY